LGIILVDSITDNQENIFPYLKHKTPVSNPVIAFKLDDKDIIKDVVYTLYHNVLN